jgi:MFS family permease
VLAVLADRTYRRLFTAQVVALLGTGLATIALGLLAFDLAEDDAGIVLGTALAIKMVAYVTIAPIAAAVAGRWPRRGFLIAMDVVRGLVALSLPFVSAVWQVYVLVFVLQAASAAFTPTFQATIPDVLVDEDDYTHALSMSRLAYDLESLVSPIAAAALLTVMSFDGLFCATAAGFAVSALLVRSVTLTRPAATDGPRPPRVPRTAGMRLHLTVPRLRGLLALQLAVAAGGAMVIVNTVVHVRDDLGRSEGDVALALGAFGAGSMIVALLLPRLLDRIGERPVMIGGGASTATTLVIAGLAGEPLGFAALLVAWAVVGAGTSAVLTPSGRLLRRSAEAPERPALFAAQFSLSHAWWMLTYPLAGVLASAVGFSPALLVLGGLALLGTLGALALWRVGDRSAPPTAPAVAAVSPPRAPRG